MQILACHIGRDLVLRDVQLEIKKATYSDDGHWKLFAKKGYLFFSTVVSQSFRYFLNLISARYQRFMSHVHKFCSQNNSITKSLIQEAFLKPPVYLANTK